MDFCIRFIELIIILKSKSFLNYCKDWLTKFFLKDLSFDITLSFEFQSADMNQKNSKYSHVGDKFLIFKVPSFYIDS